MAELVEIADVRCLVVDGEPVVRDSDGGRRLIEEAMGERARVIVVPDQYRDGSARVAGRVQDTIRVGLRSTRALQAAGAPGGAGAGE